MARKKLSDLETTLEDVLGPPDGEAGERFVTTPDDVVIEPAPAVSDLDRVLAIVDATENVDSYHVYEDRVTFVTKETSQKHTIFFNQE